MASISMLPENLIWEILLLTSPRDACRVSAVSTGIRSDTDSDVLWDQFLPSDHQEIVARSVSPLVYSTKKQLFSLLCNHPILLDSAKLSFWLDKWSGKKCYMIPSRELSIVHMEFCVIRPWHWISTTESRFREAIDLSSVRWLDIKGTIRIRTLSPKTTYVAYLVYNITKRRMAMDLRVKTWVKFVGEEGLESEKSVVYLEKPAREVPQYRLPIRRKDQWWEVKLGEFFSDGYDGEVEMQLFETEGIIRHGLVVKGIEIRPKVTEAP